MSSRNSSLHSAASASFPEQLSTPLLTVESLSCAYADHLIVSEVSFSIKEGEIACLLGPSGCGKTTLLRALAGFNTVAAGSIVMQGSEISSMAATLPPEKRQMGMVFQDYALFPHLSVADNIAFGLKSKNRIERNAIILSMLELVRLPDLSKRYPHELSGGQQQRVALARALASRPRLLLMDEPFSNLDTEMRKELSLEVRDIIKQQGIAAVVVTHDQEEAFVISDVLGILADGKLQQWGTAESLYYQPETVQVAKFVGEGELFAGVCVSPTRVQTELGLLEFAEPLLAEPILLAAQQSVNLFIRPADISPVVCTEAHTKAHTKARVLSREFMGEATRYNLQLDSGRTVSALVRELLPFKIDDVVGVDVAVHRPIVFPV
ncbi:ABC transporter ATP-binding protein [Neptunomonas antarctica]|uniref:Iron(III) transport system ATP-binding protein n=1 Tax=Neptunomonas antarctica TaxID=619304 RepID=A0A1N7NL49_9GAMM|nr:ABC transporter ATP-binding protein [Neptunomonas antarctica]SIS99011.1 iron(III) transport system ATP-binding protein [Neptunomonas antarctica]